MTEEDFLRITRIGAFRGEYQEGWDSGADWETLAQIKISTYLRNIFGLENIREAQYPSSLDRADFGFTLNDKTYAIEMKVQCPTEGQLFAGESLQLAITRDVQKLMSHDADNRWVLVIAKTMYARQRLYDAVLRGDSWSVSEEAGFVMALCNIDTSPWLPYDRFSTRNGRWGDWKRILSVG